MRRKFHVTGDTRRGVKVDTSKLIKCEIEKGVTKHRSPRKGAREGKPAPKCRRAPCQEPVYHLRPRPSAALSDPAQLPTTCPMPPAVRR